MFKVFVNHIGNVHKGDDYSECVDIFEKYKSFSESNYGIFGGKKVYVYTEKDGELVILKEH